jgi:diguanylate cyclase (GGDEF)-like protein/PAS domain S-box-containing protein
MGMKDSLAAGDVRFRMLVDAVRDYAIYLLDVEGHIVTWNAGAERNKGYTSSEILGKSFGRFFRKEDIAAGVPVAILAEAAATGHFEGEGWRVRKDGSQFWASVVVNAMRDGKGKLIGFAKVTRDLTERKRQEEALRASEQALQTEKDRLQITLYSIADGVISTDCSGLVTMMNPSAEFMTGWPVNQALGHPIHEVFNLVNAVSGIAVENPVLTCLAIKEIMHLPDGVALLARDGVRRDIQDSVAPIRTAAGELVGSILVFQDVTGFRKIQRAMEFNASHDPLTQLPNRRVFLDRLNDTLQNAKKTGLEHTVCFLDLDRLKIINDTAGHAAGDMLLRTVGDLLSRHLRGSDLLARLGGDEFGIMLHGCNVKHALETLTRILQAVASYNFHWEERVFQISVSIGVTPLTSESDVSGILKQADAACYAAKNAGRNRISVYRPNEGEGHEHHQQMSIAADVRDAVAQDRLFLFAQKIVATGKQHKLWYEILTRMRHGDGSMLFPDQFIPAAERYERVAELDRWVLERALRHHASELIAVPDLHLSINISANSLNDPNFLPFFLEVVNGSVLPATALTLEITETALINNLIAASQVIEKVRSIGCTVALDDFGVGLCSFSYLREFKVDFIKIDGRFIRNIVKSKIDFSIVRAINAIAHEIDAQTIAEFVEDDLIFNAVKELNINFAQGYGIGKPEPIEEIWQSASILQISQGKLKAKSSSAS